MNEKSLKSRIALSVVILACLVPLYRGWCLEGDPLHTVFDRYHTHGREITAFQATNELINRLGISCFFLDPSGAVHPEYSVAMDRANATPAEILDGIVAADPRMTWVPVDNQLVNVLPLALIEDPKSILYLPVDNFAVENVSLGEAIAAVTTLVPPEHRYGGLVGGTMGGLPGGETIRDRIVSVRLDSGTYLELVNALMKAAGDDVGILASGPTGFMPVKSFQRRAETKLLAHAEAFLKSEGTVDRDEAVIRFEAALADTPYTAQKKYIRFCLAELYMGSAGRLAYKLGDATPDSQKAYAIFFELALPREVSDWDANVYNQCRDYVVRLAREQGKVEEARQLLEAIIENPFSARLVEPVSIFASMIWLDVEDLNRVDRSARLLAMRAERPGNEHFHRALETLITREEVSTR